MKIWILLWLGFVSTVAHAGDERLEFSWRQGAFLAHASVLKELQALTKRQGAELTIQTLQFKQTQPMTWKACLFAEKHIGDMIAPAGAVRGEVEEISLGGRAGWKLEIRNVVSDAAATWGACD